MATNTSTPLSLIKPTIGDKTENWGESLNTNAETINTFAGGHTHTGGNDGAQINFSSLSFTGDLDLNGSDLVDAGSLSLTSAGTISATGNTLTYVTSSGSPGIINTGVRDVVSVLNYLSDGYTVRQAIINAHAELASRGGGTLLFPARSTSYDIDNTGLGPIELTTDGVWWVGDSAYGSVIRNVSTDGTGLLLCDGGSNALLRCGWKNLKFDSLSTAGEIWIPGENGLSFCRWENLWVLQKALDKSIMRGTFTDSGGMIENQWVGGVWEVGTASTQYTAIAFDLRANGNLVTFNKWQKMRFHSHNSTNYFFRLESTSTGGGALHQNEWSGINVEVPNGGFAWLLGAHGSIFSDVMFYDLQDSDGPTRDLIREDTGSGGVFCESNTYHRIRGATTDNHKGFVGTTVNVQSIIRSGTTATVTASGHGQTDGQVVYQVGADQAGYNGRFVVDRIDNDIYTIQVDSGTSTPGTGTITTASGTMDIRLGASSTTAVFVGCAGIGSSSPIQIDLNNRGAIFIGDSSSRVSLYRVNEDTSTILGQGTGAHVSTSTVFCNDIEERTAGAGITVSGAVTIQDSLVAEEGITISGGGLTFLTKASQSIVPGNIPAGTTMNFWVTVAGIESGDDVSVNPNSLPEEGLTWCGLATSSGSAIVRIANITDSTINAVGRNWLIKVKRQT